MGQGLDANAFLAAVNDTGAKFLGGMRANRRTPVLTCLGDGSYHFVIGTVPVRVVEAQITVAYGDHLFTGSYRLATALTDALRLPARPPALVALYRQRWEHESAYYALRHTIMNGRVMRSGDPAGVEQEMWALLVLHQVLRTVMVEAVEPRPGTDPDRCGFTTAIQTARDLVAQAADVITPTNPAARTGGRHRPRCPGPAPPIETSSHQHPKGQVIGLPVRGTPRRRLPRHQPPDHQPRRHHPGTRTGPAHRLPRRPAHPASRATKAARPGTPAHRPRPPLAHPRDLARHLSDITLSTMYRQLDRDAAPRPGSGPNAKANTRTPTVSPSDGAGRPTTAMAEYGTCSPRSTWPRTSYGHIKPVKRRTQFLEFCRYLRTLYPRQVRIAIVSDNFSPHLTTKK